MLAYNLHRQSKERLAGLFVRGKSMRQLAEDLGVSLSALSRWCQDAATKGDQAFIGSGHQQPEAEELRRFRRENEILRQERDILKKLWSSFRVRRGAFPLD